MRGQLHALTLSHAITPCIPFTLPSYSTPKTILDGEMIVDDDLLSDRKQRRFLAYDLMALNGKSVVGLPWKVLGMGVGCWDWGRRSALLRPIHG